jgi:hypothetical protein
MKGLTEAYRKELDLLSFHQGEITTRQSHKLAAKLIHQTRPEQKGQCAEMCVRHRQAEAGVDEPGEVWPRGHAVVQLQAMVPKLCVVQEMERGI